MENNYVKIVGGNLKRLFDERCGDPAYVPPGKQVAGRFEFKAFGESCRVSPGGIYLAGEPQTGVLGIIISLYTLNTDPEPMRMAPFRSFKEFRNTAPYHGAFATHTERILIPRVGAIKQVTGLIKEKMSGCDAPETVGGDFAFVVRPFPKIALCYIFYEADEDFPPSVTCLFSNNADRFMPNDGLADTGEYTSKKMLRIAID